MTSDELMQLKALAEAATPGDWVANKEYANRWRIDVAPATYEPLAAVYGGVSDGACTQCGSNAVFMAAANPKTILALIAKVESLAADAERLDFVIEKGAFITWALRDSTIKQCQLMNQDEDEDFHYLSGDDKYFNTVRAAIDAAMAKEKA
jgi:hypothetical protein